MNQAIIGKLYGAVLLALLWLAQASSAQTTNYWINLIGGDASGSWGTGANWSLGAASDGSDNIADFSTLNITADSTITLDGTRTDGALIFADTGGSPANNWTVNAGSGGTLQLQASANSIFYSPTSPYFNYWPYISYGIGYIPPTIAVSNGTVTINVPITATNTDSGYPSSSVLSKLGQGTLVLNGGLNSRGLHAMTGTTIVSNGIYNLSSDTADDGGFRVGTNATFIQTGGTINSPTFPLGCDFVSSATGTGTSTLIFSGGTFNNVNQFMVGRRNDAVMTVNGTATLNLALLALGENAVTVDCHLDGGVVNCWFVLTRGTSSTDTLYMNGGTLRNTRNDVGDFIPGPGEVIGRGPIDHVYVSTNGAIFDMPTYSRKVGLPLETDPNLAGAPDGGLVKLGSGGLYLDAYRRSGLPNTYTGPTVVSNGTLYIDGPVSTVSITVESNATFNPGPALSSSVNSPGVGTLTSGGDLVCEGGSTLSFDLNTDPTPGNGVNDLIKVKNMTVTGPTTIAVNEISPLSANTYTLVEYSGTLTGQNNLQLGGSLSSWQLDFSTPGQINLVVSEAAKSLTWTGGNNGNAWDVATTTNWTDFSNGQVFHNLDTVTFDGTGSANPVVNVVGIVNPANITVNASSDYTWTGDGTIGDTNQPSVQTAGLFKNGTGTLTLANAGGVLAGITNFAGTTIVAGGTWTMGPQGTSNTKEFTVEPGATFEQTGGTVYAPHYAMICSSQNGGLSGSSEPSKAIFSGGVFNCGASTVYEFMTGRYNDSVVTITNTALVQTPQFRLGEQPGYTAIANLDGGTLQCWRIGTRGTPGDHTSIFNFNGGVLMPNRDEPDFIRYPTEAITHAYIKSGGAIIDTTNFNIGINHVLETDPALGATPDGGLTVRGTTGTLTLNGAQAYTGPTVVSSGTLYVNGSIGGTTATVTGGTLAGNGAINAPVTVQSGGTLMAGTSANSIGTLTINNSLVLQAGSTTLAKVNATSATSDLITGPSSIAYGGTLVVTNLAGTLSATNTFTLFHAGSYSGSFSAVVPAMASPTLAWDTSTLAVDGTLRLVPVPYFSGVVLSGNNVILSGTNGIISGNYYVLTTTNLAAPLASWTRLATNMFDGSGNFSFTNAATGGVPQRFYRIQLP